MRGPGLVCYPLAMRSFLIVALLACSLCLPGCSSAGPSKSDVNKTTPVKREGKEPVLVELFTSEGCGNCPPADKQLAFLEANQPVADADIITLGYHVDYFNQRGWKDAYSSAEFTRRQKLYSMRLGDQEMYTPQMVVDGRKGFVGSDARKANAEITSAAQAAKPVVTASANGKTADVRITGFSQHNVATVVLAAAEDGLVSNPTAGNNRGKQLPHVSVVRTLKPFGKVPEKSTEFAGNVELPKDPSWKSENIRYVVYVQEDQSGRIIAVGRVNPAQ